MKFMPILLCLFSLSSFAQYNEPNLQPGQTKELFKTEIQLGGEYLTSENLTTVVPNGKEGAVRYTAVFNESGIKIGNQEFSAKLLPLTVKLSVNGDDNWDEANLKTMAHRIRGEVARFFFQPEGTDLFMNVGTIAFDYKKFGPQANHPSGVEVTQMDVADLNIGYRIHNEDGKWQIIFSGYAAVQMVNVHDNDFIDHNNQLLGKNVAGSYGLSMWGEVADIGTFNISWYNQLAKMDTRDFNPGDNLTWSHHNITAGFDLSLGKIIHEKLAPISLTMKYTYNLATFNDNQPGMKPVQMQQTGTQTFEVGIKVNIGGWKKKKKPVPQVGW